MMKTNPTRAVDQYNVRYKPCSEEFLTAACRMGFDLRVLPTYVPHLLAISAEFGKSLHMRHPRRKVFRSKRAQK